MTRQIKKIIIHCSATPENMDIGAAEIDTWHRQRGWAGNGYHFVIRRNGAIEKGRPVERSGAHARGHNADSIGVCLVGGVDTHQNPVANFTEAQWRTLSSLVDSLLSIHGPVEVIGHNEVSAKACPSFDVQEWLENRNVPNTPDTESTAPLADSRREGNSDRQASPERKSQKALNPYRRLFGRLCGLISHFTRNR